MARRAGPLFAALVLLLACAAPRGASALSWRLFAGREECIQEYMPEHQWELARQRETDPDLSSVTIDLGVVISSRFGTEGQKASVDLRVLSPSDVELYSEPAVTEANMLTTGTGGRGPWKACFRVSRGRLLRPSVIVRVTHFTVNHASLLGTRFEWQRGGPRAVLGDGDGRGLGGAVGSSPPVETLASASQIDELVEGLQRLDHYILNVTHEQRYLSARTDRHLVTVESTHSRTLFYHVALDVVIIAAAFAQIVGVRLMFKRSRRQGIII